MHLYSEFCNLKYFFKILFKYEASGMDDTTQRRDQLSCAVSNVNIECQQYLNM